MSTQTVDFSNSIPMDIHSIVEATTSNRPQLVSTPEPSKEVNRLRDLKTSARDQLMIDPRIIVVDDGHNPRNYVLDENRAHLDELKRSIRENGVLVPLLVRFDAARKAAVLVDGECRLRATLELIAEGVEIDTVPTVQVSGGNESERLLIAITANTGKPLSKWELGTAFQKLYNFGWAPEKIATKTGYAQRFVSEAMELSDAPDEVKQLLSSQAVTPSLALAELRANGAAAVQTLQAKAVQAQAAGQKTATRSKSVLPTRVAQSTSTAPAGVSKTLRNALIAMFADVPATDMEANIVDGRELNSEVYVNRAKLVAVAEAFANDPFFNRK